MAIFKAEETKLFIPFIINLNRGLKKKKSYVFSLVSLKFQVYFITADTFKKTLKMHF